MGKISPISGKYIIHASIEIEGVVDRPDVIGAIFGQTEGLLGSELELRELQRSGRIGRIEVNTDIKMGKTKGEIIIPSSMDKAETAIIGAALEVIERIGPCNAHIKIQNIEDIRVAKRKQVVDRAKALLKELIDGVMPDSQEIAEEVASSVRVMEITTWGSEKLAAGPAIDESDEVILVEGRADVLSLLKNGFKNAIAMNGSNLPKSIIPLCKEKIVTIFVDGDRGGDLIVKEVTGVAEIDFITKAPDGKEVEELTKKEIHKAIRSRVTLEQALSDLKDRGPNKQDMRKNQRNVRAPVQRSEAPRRPQQSEKITLNAKQKSDLSGMLENLVGTHGAFILDEKFNILGKVPKSELEATIKSVGSSAYAIVVDGAADKDIVTVAENNNVSCLVSMEAKFKSNKISILTPEAL